MRRIFTSSRVTHAIIAALLLAIAWSHDANAQSTSADSADARIRRAVADYAGLYRRDTLDEWEKLFLPSFTAANTRADGGLSLRTRDEFLASQRRYHERAVVTEELENVRIERNGRMASVWADFVVNENGQRSRGKLVLLAMEDAGRFRFHALMFAYDR